MAKFTYSCLSIKADGSYYLQEKKTFGRGDVDIIAVNDVNNRAQMLELINSWNSQAIHTREGIPRHIYYLHVTP